jgi:hypothetical protein
MPEDALVVLPFSNPTEDDLSSSSKISAKSALPLIAASIILVADVSLNNFNTS